jgi:hypothetical protein
MSACSAATASPDQASPRSRRSPAVTTTVKAFAENHRRRESGRRQGQRRDRGGVRRGLAIALSTILSAPKSAAIRGRRSSASAAWASSTGARAGGRRQPHPRSQDHLATVRERCRESGRFRQEAEKMCMLEQKPSCRCCPTARRRVPTSSPFIEGRTQRLLTSYSADTSPPYRCRSDGSVSNSPRSRGRPSLRQPGVAATPAGSHRDLKPGNIMVRVSNQTASAV